MSFKTVIFVNFIILISIFKEVASKKSFTILVDTTQSMVEEMDVIRTKLGNVVYSLNDTSDVDSFILLYFNDQDVGPPQLFSTASGLLTAVNALRVEGGLDCPEDSLAGIQKALEVSNPESYIFLFTDAYAKDVSKLAAIENLCGATRSQIVVFLTGRCVPTTSSPTSSFEVFYDITRACSGTVFRLQPNLLDQAFRFMKEIVGQDWDITTQDTFTRHREIKISNDPLTSDLVLAVNGEQPTIQILSADNTIPHYEKIVDTTNSQVVRLHNTGNTNYTIYVRSHGLTSATIYRKTKLPFTFGFTTKRPRVLKETSDSPMAGFSNYLLIVPREPSVRISSVELLFVDEGTSQVLALEENQNTHNTYIASTFFEPDKPFKIIVTAHDMNTYKDMKLTTKVLNPQKLVGEIMWTKPVVEVVELEPTLVEYGKSTTLACKVTGHPRPSIHWETDDGTVLTSEDILLKLPNVHISYATIDKVDRNQTVNCVAKNMKGEVAERIRLFYKRLYTFDIIQTPKDDTFEYGTKAEMFCEVNAYPEATIKWYHNGTEIGFYNSNIKIVPEKNALVIKNMSLHETGEYTCEVSNEATTRTFSAIIYLSGIESPEIYLPYHEIALNVGVSWEIECRSEKGKPHPVTMWRKIYDDVLNDIPADIIVDENRLKINKVASEHAGTYRCLADNIFGEDHRDLTITVQYAPEISNTDEESVVVKEGELVELKCDVKAFPRARVHWDFQQDDVIIGFDERHKTDDQNSHKFLALWKDSGSYHCVAENSVGRSEKTVKVNVLVPPYIQTPVAKKLIVKAGAAFNLVCNVLYGNPVPTTKWEFTAPNSTTTIVSRDKSTKELRLENVSKEQEGSYMCIADNEVGSDSITVDLTVRD